MITSTIKYGGTLQIGDFICLGNSWGLAFGWYSGNGKSGTIQFVSPRNILWDFKTYSIRTTQPGGSTFPKDRKGFTLDHISKAYVRSNHANRVLKITCPDDVFTGEDLQNYLVAERILKDMKFLKELSYDSRKTSPV